MKLSLKPLDEQVIVITGASSGIGLATARRAARKGAAVVLNSRDEQDILKAAEEIRSEGGRAVHFTGDVADAKADLPVLPEAQQGALELVADGVVDRYS